MKLGAGRYWEYLMCDTPFCNADEGHADGTDIWTEQDIAELLKLPLTRGAQTALSVLSFVLVLIGCGFFER